MDEQFLSPLEVAEILQVKKNTVYEMIKRGDLKATKMGKQFRIARKDVYEYMGVMPETESPENIVIWISCWMCSVLCITVKVTDIRRCTVLRWEVTAVCTGCIRMKIMWLPAICGTGRQIPIICRI